MRSPWCADCMHHDSEHEPASQTPLRAPRCNKCNALERGRIPHIHCPAGFRTRGQHSYGCELGHGGLCNCGRVQEAGNEESLGVGSNHHGHTHVAGDYHGSIDPNIKHEHVPTARGIPEQLPDDIRDMKIDKSQRSDPLCANCRHKQSGHRENACNRWHANKDGVVQCRCPGFKNGAHKVAVGRIGSLDPVAPGHTWEDGSHRPHLDYYGTCKKCTDHYDALQIESEHGGRGSYDQLPKNIHKAWGNKTLNPEKYALCAEPTQRKEWSSAVGGFTTHVGACKRPAVVTLDSDHPAVAEWARKPVALCERHAKKLLGPEWHVRKSQATLRVNIPHWRRTAGSHKPDRSSL